MAPIDAAPRLLLQGLRQIMAEPADGQTRLNKIVQEVAKLMVSEVCSIYLKRRDGSLELFATQGLKQSAVHKTHMNRGEGLSGLIVETAEPVNLSEAQSHPSFSYRPETGEEIYHSFLGVPILRGGNVLGVLVIQNRTQRQYADDEVEVLQTTAMVLAEHIASGDVVGINDDEFDNNLNEPITIEALPLSDGIAMGHIVLHEPRVAVTQLMSDNPVYERARLDEGIINLRKSIDRMLERAEMAKRGEHRDVLEAFRMFAHDRTWTRTLRDAVATGLTAEAAVEAVQNKNRAMILRNEDPFWRERSHDLDDLSNRLMRILTGASRTAAADEQLPDDAILIARTMGPAELLDYDPKKLRGLVIEEGSPTSHVAIVARALGIAALGQVGRVVDRVESGNAAVIDTETQEFHIRPRQDLIDAYADKVRFRARRQEQYKELRDTKAVTKDGQRIQMQVNAGLMVDLDHLHESGADGIGLFRTELQFMISSTFPRRDKQTAIYSEILERAKGKRVIFRSLDIGGDKVLPYLRHSQEENPAMGWRAVRMSLDRPALLRTQLRALIKAAEGQDLWLMLPMVSDVAEYREARQLVEKERTLAFSHGRKLPRSIKLGAMLEVPSLLWQLDELFSEVDFVSVGSNDLLQFFYASDRGNFRVAERYDPLSRPALRMLKQIADCAKKHDKQLTLCGELAGHPLEAMALVGLGFRSISMAPASIGPVKSMLLSLDANAIGERMDELLNEYLGNSIRAELEAFAVKHGVDLPGHGDEETVYDEAAGL